MGWNFKNELARKFVHLLSIFILLIYFIASDAFNKQIALVILVLILIIFLEFEYLRIETGGKIPVLNKIWKYVRREKEKDKLGGDIFFLLGAILVLAVFDLKVAMAAILMTTFGDMSAALIGKRFGKHAFFLKERTWEGTLSEFFVDLLIGFFVFFSNNFHLVYDWQLWIVFLAMALTATFVETIVYKMDDNLLIPIFAGFVGQIVLFLFGRFF
jgi:phytol kinase